MTLLPISSIFATNPGNVEAAVRPIKADTSQTRGTGLFCSVRVGRLLTGDAKDKGGTGQSGPHQQRTAS